MNRAYPLSECPDKIDTYKEIASCYNGQVVSSYNLLTPQERTFIYYMFRASLPGHRIFADQCHRHTLEVIALFEDLLRREDNVIRVMGDKLALSQDESRQFIKELRTYLVYLWTNHGAYFKREQAKNKRTPKNLGMTVLTQDMLLKVMQSLDYQNALEKVTRLAKSIFDDAVEHTLCVAGSIEQSAGNIYEHGFTEEDFQKLSAHEQHKINAYFYRKDGKPAMQAYKVGGKYDQELSISVYWLQKAYEHVQLYPEQFDAYFVESLRHMIVFLTTGDEQAFKDHSIAWTKSNSRLDYLFGFIETYQDPKDARGMFSAEVTVKSVDMQTLNKLLPQLESTLPFPEEYKRQNLTESAAIPNASINIPLFGTGDAGPLQMTAAYCLPNYSDIRAQYGSKQIMYQVNKGLGELLNPDLNRTLFHSSEQVAWLKQNDPEGHLHRDIWTVHCILHETLGHGSGRLATHTFKDGEPLSINGVTYKVGDTVPVTNDMLTVFLTGIGSSLEELRAEIIALYTSIAHFDELAKAGLYKDWPQKIGKQELIKQFIIDMAFTGLRRLWTQPDGVNEISGAHAQANVVIMEYLLEAGGMRLTEEKVSVDGVEHTVLGFAVDDADRVISTIEKLAIEVQRIKSTGDSVAGNALIHTYGKYRCNQEHVKVLKKNLQAVMGDLKVQAYIYPFFEPVMQGEKVIDSKAYWPADLIEQHMKYAQLSLSKKAC